MKIKTAELIGPALDWAVNKLLHPEFPEESWSVFHPSTFGSEVIDLMERERVYLSPRGDGGLDVYIQHELGNSFPSAYASGPTIRIAVCRCYVASRLGEEVDIPEELLK